LIHFAKYEGAGNDFILIDDRAALFPYEDKSFIQSICHRQKGIGADGVILLTHAQKEDANFRMRIFNADGSEASMCGNGLRCLVRFIEKLNIETIPLQIETLYGIHSCLIRGEEIQTDLCDVEEQLWDGYLDGQRIYVINTGVPHLVMFVDDLDTVDVHVKGKALRFHENFAPEGVNVNFAKRLSSHHLALRTYERGVEAETLACGTGSAAVAYVVSKLYSLEGPIALQTRSGEILKVTRKESSLSLSGPARFVFAGTI
jgi:diaminopimelate epimerase